MTSYSQLIALYKSDPENVKHLRLGQWFVNTYIKKPWPELFYANEKLAEHMIRAWLNDHQYIDVLPTPIVRS